MHKNISEISIRTNISEIKMRWDHKQNIDDPPNKIKLNYQINVEGVSQENELMA